MAACRVSRRGLSSRHSRPTTPLHPGDVVVNEPITAPAGTVNTPCSTHARGHRIVYTLMPILLAFSLITGLAMYKPAQFWWLSGLFSFGEVFGATSWHTLRLSHLATIPAIALLIGAHITLSWRIGGLRLLRGMFL